MQDCHLGGPVGLGRLHDKLDGDDAPRALLQTLQITHCEKKKVFKTVSEL